MTVDKETEKKISQLQLLEQGLQNFNLQKQQTQSKFLEIDSALKELNMGSDNYKIIGNIMVKADNKKLKQELEDEKEIIKIKIKSLEKQETSMREKAKKIQTEVMNNMNKEQTK